MTLCIIPARGNSKRFPRKNIQKLNGLPLICHVIERCKNASIFDEIVVSTEDDEIAEISSQAGAYVWRRQPNLSLDTSTVVQVCEDVLRHYQNYYFCCVYPTAVLLTSQTIKKSYEKFKKVKGAEGLMATSSYNYSPLQALNISNNQWASLLHTEVDKLQSQSYPRFEVSNGTFYWAIRTNFLEQRTFYLQKLKTILLDENEVIDLDEPSQFNELVRKFENK